MIVTIIIAAVATICVLGAGGALTEIGPWYHSLRSPPWRPPNWAFGPVWSTIGVLTCASAVIIWRASATDEEKVVVIGLFAVNAGFNILWSLFFFKLRRPDWALIEVAFLWMSILALMLDFYPRSPLAAVLLVPYIVWVSIAALLNRAMVRLNAPFDGSAERRGMIKGQG
ncbi:TspO/MBR family protein [Acidisoma cladoniae]|uniref:TspO/MBR family protein n=1 Tax=Acidisoma cladoniae TaxID=3040935 RepID=UPI00254A07EB|nr:TspO/MBR family protein [Acidisoma sp. PAMC 29798]